jgi:NAD(P)H-dependent FMN reductase
MWTLILNLFGNVKTLLIAAGGAIAGIYLLLMKRKVKVQEDVIHSQEQAIEVHKKKDEIHKKDQEIDKETKDKIQEVKDDVEKLPDDQAAQKISDNLNDFFGTGPK